MKVFGVFPGPRPDRLCADGFAARPDNASSPREIDAWFSQASSDEIEALLAARKIEESNP